MKKEEKQPGREKRIVDFFFELGNMRKLLRSHRQLLLTDDMSDNIASHSYRVAMIGWILAKEEGLDPYKTVMMCLLHDTEEVRSSDHNYLHKRYVKVFPDEIDREQLGTLPHEDLLNFVKEYRERKTNESLVAKDADLLDQILLLREYAWQGNREAQVWLEGKGGEKENGQLARLKTQSARMLGERIMNANPSDWWSNLFTSEDR